MLAYTAANATNVGGITLAQNTDAVVVQASANPPWGATPQQVAIVGGGSKGTTANLNLAEEQLRRFVLHLGCQPDRW